jgi:YfiR/HmsC-like
MAFLSRRGLALIPVLWMLVWSVPAPAAGQATEADVKAAFLYNFTKYIDWPPEAFQSPEDPFRLCVVSNPEFTQGVRNLIAGETARGRPLELTVPGAADLPHCHILFVGLRESSRAAALVAATSGRPVLTVGESAGFLEHGGTVLFEVENHRVRFDINLSAASRAGLVVSSKLVRVARTIYEAPSR